MKKIPISLNNIEEFLLDNFSDSELNDSHNIVYLNDLNKLKTALKEMIYSNVTSFTNISNAISEVEKIMIRIQRIRCVISPNLKMIVQRHNDGNEREYLFARGYWVDDNGNTVRTVAKLFGRMDVKHFVHPTPEEVKLTMRRIYSRKYHETYEK